MLKIECLISVLFFLLSTSCQSQSLLPFSDLDEIEKGKSILMAYTCDELTEKANDANFSLKSLAAIRALGRCKDFSFDIKLLSDFERKLYANEITSLDTTKIENNLIDDLPIKDLKTKIKNEKIATMKFKYYKLLRLKLKKTSDRKDYLKSTHAAYIWALQNFKTTAKSKEKNNEAYAFLYEASQLAAKTYWTESNIHQANKIINESIARLKTHHSIAELFYIKGRILEEASKTTEALTYYDLTIEDINTYKPKNLSFNIDRLLWVKAWISYKDKKYAEAEKAFAHLAETTPDLSEKSRAQFYQGRSLKFLTKDTEAKNIFENIIQNDFFGYYGLVSYRELNKKFPAVNDIQSVNKLKYDLALKFLSASDKTLFTDLIKYREFNLAEKAIGLVSKSTDNELNLGLYFAKNCQLYMPLFRTFAKLDNTEKIDVFINYPTLIFPQPYKDEVKQMATKTNLPSSLIYSIMKQESAFNEKARSPADAMGLMQVIPKLAQRISKKFEVPYRSSRDLYNPVINIQLGSFELMEQVKKQNGQLSYVAAAYNAGPGALAGWLKNRKRDDVLEFIEEIPYDETRTYVKLIARNKLFYERISNRDTEHSFPTDFLN